MRSLAAVTSRSPNHGDPYRFTATVSVAVALVCLAVAGYLAFDWADYGSDSTCGNFIRYKGAGGTCAHVMRNRVIAVVALVAFAGVVLLAVWWRVHRGRSAHSQGTG
jgi:hypothetical protein